MPDIIQLLPDSVANQIAAGEVIQRPASVIKELVENSVDAGATEITVIIKDAGRTLIQIIDNGCGMSETDARLSFERHATSKIRKADDLFNIRTFGFRGEALASIAAVAVVDLKTRKYEDEIGTHICISDSVVQSQQQVSCSAGTNFMIRNLFFNVPARRKFLKTHQTETKHIFDEFQRIALAYPEIWFKLISDEKEIFNLPIAGFKQRIINIFGKHCVSNLVSVSAKTSLIEITGYVGKPEIAKKNSGEQYFFVNRRYIRHPFFYRSIMNAYDKILAPETHPSFFLNFTVNPGNIDINIHPTKTEVKFTDEIAIAHIIQAAAKESLGKFNIMPSIDFEIDSLVEMPMRNGGDNFVMPAVEVNPEFNPFDRKQITLSSSITSDYNKKNHNGWEKLYQPNVEFVQSSFNELQSDEKNQIKIDKHFFQLKNRYILTTVKSGILVIDQKRAHERILFEKYVSSLQDKIHITQASLFPKTIELNHSSATILKEILSDINKTGYDIREFGSNTFVVNGTPAEAEFTEPKELIENFIEIFTRGSDIITEAKENLAFSLARACSIGFSKTMNHEEMQSIFDNLFASQTPNFTPDGKTIFTIISVDEIEKKLN